jgi:hypothetical protein
MVENILAVYFVENIRESTSLNRLYEKKLEDFFGYQKARIIRDALSP